MAVRKVSIRILARGPDTRIFSTTERPVRCHQAEDREGVSRSATELFPNRAQNGVARGPARPRFEDGSPGAAIAGGRAQRRSTARRSRTRTSSAMEASAGFPVRSIEATGSIAATSVRPSPASRTMTLHGKSTPSLSSICSARWAKDGLQAPRIRYGGRSAPSLAVALHVNLDKTLRLRKETSTAQAAWVNRC